MRRILFVTIINVLMTMNVLGQEKKPDFNFPKDVVRNSEAQLKSALERKDGISMVDALVKIAIAKNKISYELKDEVIAQIEDVINQEKRADFKSILWYLESCIYNDDYDDAKSDSLKRLSLSNKEELQKHRIEEYKSLFRYDALGLRLCPTLYDFLKYRTDGEDYIWSIQNEEDKLGHKLMNEYGKQFYQSYVDYIKDHPNSPWNNAIRNRIGDVEAQNARISYKSQAHSGDQIEVKVTSENARDVELVVYSVTADTKDRYQIDRKKLKKLKSYQVPFDSEETFFNAEKTIMLESLPKGQYYIDVYVNGNKTMDKHVYLYQVFKVDDNAEYQVNNSEKEYITEITVDTKTGVNVDTRNRKRKSHEFVGKPQQSLVQLNVLTDLGIYRPGETLRYTVVCSEATAHEKHVMPNRQIEVRLKDRRYNEVKCDTLTTDDFGQVKGEFVIPTDCENGTFSIVASVKLVSSIVSASHYVKVSEYKTPKFYVDVKDNPSSYLKDHDVIIKGRCLTYSGVPLANNDVKIRVNSTHWWRWAFDVNNNNSVYFEETVKTDKNGEFTLCIKADRLTAISRYYNTEFTVTDDAGETQEAQHSFFVGKLRGLSYNGEKNFLADQPEISLPISLVTSDPDDAVESFRYKLTDVEDTTKVIASGTLKLNDPKLEVSKIASGNYRLLAEIDNAEQNIDANIVIFRSRDTSCPVASAMWIPECGRKVDADGMAHVKIGTAYNSHIFYVAHSSLGLVSQGWLDYQPGIHEFSIQLPEHEKQSATVQFLCYYEGELLHEDIYLENTLSQKKLLLKINSFRDKLTPGSREKWSFSVEGQKPSNRWGGRLALEVLSEAVNKLNMSPWSVNARLLNKANVYVSADRIGYRSNSGYYRSKYLEETRYSLPNLNLYDYYWWTWDQNLSDLNDAIVVGYGVQTTKSARRMAAPMAMAKMPNAMESFVAVEDDAIQEAEANAGIPDPLQQPDFSNINMRESETKVALWEPMIDFDKNGNATVEFDVPLDNTTWRMRAFAFDKEMTVSNTLSELIVAQRPVMVTPSLPRFLRTGDKTILMSNVLNSSEEEQTADVLIDLFDPRTNEVIETKSHVVTVAAGDMKAVGISVTAPDNMTYLGYRIKATVNGAGDGEQQMIPVLPAVTPVVETIPFYLNPNDKDTVIDLSRFPATAHLTYEYCNNPVWYCLDALPSIYDKDATTASAIMHSLYAIALNEGIKKLVKADLPKLEYNSADRDELIKKLCALQNADGGISWFNWDRRVSSEYITYQVLELLGEIRHLGYEIDDESLKNLELRALKYYEAQQLKNLAQQKKYNKKHEYLDFEPYLYLRTLYPRDQYPITDANASLLSKALKAVEKEWRQFSITKRGFVALSLARNNRLTTAKLIIESLRQHAMNDPRRGMFWDNTQQFGFRWYNRTAITAMLLEAFNEVDPRLEEIDQIRKWMLLEKQTTNWGSSSMASEATYAILSTGSEWLRNTESAEYIKEEISNPSALNPQLSSINPKPLTINHQPGSPAWGAVYAQFPSVVKETKAFKLQEIEIRKELYKYVDNKVVAVDQLHIGDKIQVQLTVTTDRDMQYVTIRDSRAACFEPADKTSGYKYSDKAVNPRKSIGYYNDTKDTETRLMIDFLPKGTHIVTYDVFVTNAGEFCTGLAEVTCDYAPQFTAHTAGDIIFIDK